MKRYLKYVRPYLKFFIFGPIFMLTEVAGEVMLPKLMSLSIKNGMDKGDASYVLMIGGVMIGTALIMMAGGVCGGYFATRASTGFAKDLRRDTFCKVQEFSFANIDKFSTGSLVTRLTNDVTQLQNLVRMGLIMMLRAPGMLIGAIIMAVTVNISLAAVIAIVVPVLGIFLALIITRAHPRFTAMQDKIDKVNSAIQENLTNVRVVKSFVHEDLEEEKFAKANVGLRDSAIHAFKLVIFTMPLMTFIMSLTTMLVVWFGGKQIIIGDMDVADLTAFTTYIVQILSSLMMLSMVLLNSSRAIASARRIKEVLDTEVDLTDDKATEKDAAVSRGGIEFRNVSFRYYKNSEGKVLDNISLKISPGSTVGIIGSTGCGKTSLVQLVPRLYDCDEGEVLVDGINVKDYSLKHLRDSVAMVLQKNVLFSGTIKENLMWGKEDGTDSEYYEAAQQAQAHNFIEQFPEGYDTELGQGGVNVSGGQKQRLCIARALLKSPRILILDDSTSAIDTDTEARIREAFDTKLNGTTKLIIAQRISSVMNADQIVVMDDGQIVGKGTHEELLEGCEAYREIYYSQMDKERSAS